MHGDHERLAGGAEVSGSPRAPLFLVGAQRSGTTALAHVLSAAYAEQFGATFTVNGKLWYFLRRWLTPDDIAARHLRADEIVHALNRRPPQGSGASAWLADVDRALREAARAVSAGRYPATAHGVRALARDLAASVHGPREWGDKYNEYLLDLPFLDDLFPAARWIMLFRHPAEVVASMLAWSGDRPWNPRTAADAEAKWVAWNRCWLDFRAKLPPERFTEIDYADLCTGRGLEDLMAFTGLDLTGRAEGLSRRSAAAIGTPVTAAGHTWAELRGAYPEPPLPGGPAA